jgi:hypothetical protein
MESTFAAAYIGVTEENRFIEVELARNAAEPVQPLPVPGNAALDTLLHDTVLRYQR